MADPFEVRMRFTSQLQHLNASTTSALKAANYALRYAEFSDDLHSCILEQLERNNMNNRANIMYFLPALCDAAKAQGEPGYVRMIERDILRIIDLAAPDDGSGAANVKVVRKVLQQLQAKAFLPPHTVAELDECIAARESAGYAAALSSPPPPPHSVSQHQQQQQHQHQHQQQQYQQPASVPAAAPSGGNAFSRPMGPASEAAAAGTGSGGAGVGGGVGVITPAMRSTPQSTTRDAAGHFHAGVRLDKRQIEQRIEEDRERHKRAREGIWAIAQPSTDLAEDAEFDKSWNEAGGADDDDNQRAREEGEERAKHLEFDEY